MIELPCPLSIETIADKSHEIYNLYEEANRSREYGINWYEFLHCDYESEVLQLAKKWWKEYLTYHNGIDQGVKYCIGYFANETHRANLYKWLV